MKRVKVIVLMLVLILTSFVVAIKITKNLYREINIVNYTGVKNAVI